MPSSALSAAARTRRHLDEQRVPPPSKRPQLPRFERQVPPPRSRSHRRRMISLARALSMRFSEVARQTRNTSSSSSNRSQVVACPRIGSSKSIPPRGTPTTSTQLQASRRGRCPLCRRRNSSPRRARRSQSQRAHNTGKRRWRPLSPPTRTRTRRSIKMPARQVRTLLQGTMKASLRAGLSKSTLRVGTRIFSTRSPARAAGRGRARRHSWTRNRARP